MEKNLKKNRYIYITESLGCAPKLIQHCKSTTVLKEVLFVLWFSIIMNHVLELSPPFTNALLSNIRKNLDFHQQATREV